MLLILIFLSLGSPVLFKMDEIDRKILESLRKNGRITYVEMGQSLGLSESAIRKRVQALMDEGIIVRFTIDIAPSAEVRALIMISINPSTPTENISEALQKLPGIRYIYEVTGEYDTVAVVSSLSMEGLNQIIEKIRNVTGVSRTNTIIVLRTL